MLQHCCYCCCNIFVAVLASTWLQEHCYSIVVVLPMFATLFQYCCCCCCCCCCRCCRCKIVRVVKFLLLWLLLLLLHFCCCYFLRALYTFFFVSKQICQSKDKRANLTLDISFNAKYLLLTLHFISNRVYGIQKKLFYYHIKLC